MYCKHERFHVVLLNLMHIKHWSLVQLIVLCDTDDITDDTRPTIFKENFSYVWLHTILLSTLISYVVKLALKRGLKVMKKWVEWMSRKYCFHLILLYPDTCLSSHEWSCFELERRLWGDVWLRQFHHHPELY